MMSPTAPPKRVRLSLSRLRYKAVLLGGLFLILFFGIILAVIAFTGGASDEHEAILLVDSLSVDAKTNRVILPDRGGDMRRMQRKPRDKTQMTTDLRYELLMQSEEQLRDRFCCLDTQSSSLCWHHKYEERGSTRLKKSSVVHSFYLRGNHTAHLPSRHSDGNTSVCLPLPNYNLADPILTDYDQCPSGEYKWVSRTLMDSESFLDAVVPHFSSSSTGTTAARSFINSSVPIFDHWLPWGRVGEGRKAASAAMKTKRYPPLSGIHDPNQHNLYNLQYFCIDANGRLLGNPKEEGVEGQKTSPLASFEGYHEHFMFPNMTAAQKLLHEDNIHLTRRGRDSSLFLQPIAEEEFIKLGDKEGNDLGDPVLIIPLDAQSMENPGHITHRFSTSAAIARAKRVKGIIFVTEFGERAPPQLEEDIPTTTTTTTTAPHDDDQSLPWEQHMCSIIAAYHMARGTLHQPLAMIGFYQMLRLPHATVNTFGGSDVWIRAGDDVEDRCGLEEDAILLASKSAKEISVVPAPRSIPPSLMVPVEVYSEVLRRLFVEASDMKKASAANKTAVLHFSVFSDEHMDKNATHSSGISFRNSAEEFSMASYSISSRSSGKDLVRHFRYRLRFLIQAVTDELKVRSKLVNSKRNGRMCFRNGLIMQVHHQQVLITNSRLALGMATAPNCHSKAVLAEARRAARACACERDSVVTAKNKTAPYCADEVHYILGREAARQLEAKYAEVMAPLSHGGQTDAGHQAAFDSYDDLFMALLAQHPVRVYVPWRTKTRRLRFFSEYFPILYSEVGKYFSFTFNEGLRKDRSTQMRHYLTTDIMLGVHGADMHGSAFLANTSLLAEITLGPFDSVVPLQRGMFGLYAYSKEMGYLRFQAHTKGPGWPRTYPYLSLDSARGLLSLSLCTWLATNSVKLKKPFLLPFWCREQKPMPTKDVAVLTPINTSLNKFGFTPPACPAFTLIGPRRSAVMDASDQHTSDARIGYGRKELVSRCFSNIANKDKDAIYIPKNNKRETIGWCTWLWRLLVGNPNVSVLKEDEGASASMDMTQTCVYPALTPNHLRRIQQECVHGSFQIRQNVTEAHMLLVGLKGLLEAHMGLSQDDAAFVAEEALLRRVPTVNVDEELEEDMNALKRHPPWNDPLLSSRNDYQLPKQDLHSTRESLTSNLQDILLSSTHDARGNYSKIVRVVIRRLVEDFMDVVASKDAPDPPGEVDYPFYSFDPVRFDHCKDYLA